jgi:hypothetical protein
MVLKVLLVNKGLLVKMAPKASKAKMVRKVTLVLRELEVRRVILV